MDFLGNLGIFLFGANKDGSIDRIVFWTFVLAIIALRQLWEMSRTARADFIYKFTDGFFNQESRSLMLLFEYDLLTFEIKKVNDQEFPCFKLDDKKLNDLEGIDGRLKDNFKPVYTMYDIDDRFLGHFEDLGNYERKGLLDIQMIYEGFSYYIKSIWENNEMKKYIKWEKTVAQDMWTGVEYIYSKVISYGEAKKHKSFSWLWKLEWRWRILRNLYRKQ
jgi:hypothetical protein